MKFQPGLAAGFFRTASLLQLKQFQSNYKEVLHERVAVRANTHLLDIDFFSVRTHLKDVHDKDRLVVVPRRLGEASQRRSQEEWGTTHRYRSGQSLPSPFQRLDGQERRRPQERMVVGPRLVQRSGDAFVQAKRCQVGITTLSLVAR